MPSRIERVASAERLSRPRRSPSIAAIGASSFGGLLETVWPRAVGFEPRDLRPDHQHLPEHEDDAEQEHAQDHAVEPGIGVEGVQDLRREEAGDHQHGGQEDHHAHQETTWVRSCPPPPRDGAHRGGPRMSTRSAGPPPADVSNACTVMRPRAIPRSIRKDRTARARPSEIRRALLAVATAPA